MAANPFSSAAFKAERDFRGKISPALARRLLSLNRMRHFFRRDVPWLTGPYICRDSAVFRITPAKGFSFEELDSPAHHHPCQALVKGTQLFSRLRVL